MTQDCDVIAADLFQGYYWWLVLSLRLPDCTYRGMKQPGGERIARAQGTRGRRGFRCAKRLPLQAVLCSMSDVRHTVDVEHVSPS